MLHYYWAQFSAAHGGISSASMGPLASGPGVLLNSVLWDKDKGSQSLFCTISIGEGKGACKLPSAIFVSKRKNSSQV